MSDFKIGIQLYSLRDDMEKDMEGTLKKVAEMGYDCVEFAGYFGHSAEEIRGWLDKYGLEAVSVHQTYDVFLENEQENIEYLKKLGVSYCVIPWMGIEKHKGSDVYDATIADIKKVAKALKAAGIKMGYHNHDFEYELFEGKPLIDWLYGDIPADLLDAEFDTCWVKYAGFDPCEYIEKYSERVNLVHLKDFTCKKFAGGPAYDLISSDGTSMGNETKEDNGFVLKPLGDGLQDFPSIIESAKKAGASYLIYEQDNSADIAPIEAAKKSREYLKSIGY